MSPMVQLAIGVSLGIVLALGPAVFRALFPRKPPIDTYVGDGTILGTPGPLEPGPLRVYIAASSREMPRVDKALAAIDALGIGRVEITYRWIDDMRKAGKSDVDLTLKEAQEAAKNCLDGVRTCHVFWLLYPIEPTRGAWVELGYATALMEIGIIPLFVVSHEKLLVADPDAPPGTGACIFTRPPNLDEFHGPVALRPLWVEARTDNIGLASVLWVEARTDDIGLASVQGALEARERFFAGVKSRV